MVIKEYTLSDLAQLALEHPIKTIPPLFTPHYSRGSKELKF
jgi:hypothetical protein